MKKVRRRKAVALVCGVLGSFEHLKQRRDLYGALLFKVGWYLEFWGSHDPVLRPRTPALPVAFSFGVFISWHLHSRIFCVNYEWHIRIRVCENFPVLEVRDSLSGPPNLGIGFFMRRRGGFRGCHLLWSGLLWPVVAFSTSLCARADFGDSGGCFASSREML